MTKVNVIQRYKQEVALCTIPSLQLTTNSTNDLTKPKKPCQIILSNWTIRRKTGHKAPAFTHPHGGDAVALVRDIQRAIRQKVCLAEPPITLLMGHWSSNLTSNFILTFAGNPQAELVYKFEKEILAQHFNYSFQLALNFSYTKLAVFGVPIMRDHNGNLPSTDHLRYELGKNVAIKGSKLIDGPTWSRAAHEDKSLTTSCIHFVIHNPNCQKTTQITQAHNCMYGKPVAIKITASLRAYTQCS